MRLAGGIAGFIVLSYSVKGIEGTRYSGLQDIQDIQDVELFSYQAFKIFKGKLFSYIECNRRLCIH